MLPPKRWFPSTKQECTVTEEGNLQQSLLPFTNISSLYVLQYWRNSDILQNDS